MSSTSTAGLPASISPGLLTSFLDHVRLVGQGVVGYTDKLRNLRAAQDRGMSTFYPL